MELVLPAGTTPVTEAPRPALSRLRVLLLLGMAAITIGGIAFRQFPDPNPARIARVHARERCSEAMDAVFERRFSDSAQAATAALTELDRFPEARTVLALAALGLGEFERARREGRWALGDYAAGYADPRTVKSKVAMDTLAGRVVCVAESALGGAAPATDGPALFDGFLAFSGALSCQAGAEALGRLPAAVRAVLERAREACPAPFACSEQPAQADDYGSSQKKKNSGP